MREIVFAMLTVSDVMITRPKVSDVATTVRQARGFFTDDHVHALLVVDGRTLLAVVERNDLATEGPDTPVRTIGKLDGRVVPPDAALVATWHRMVALTRRRLAVVEEDGALVGLLCLKRSGRGFCTDAGVAERAE